MHLNKAIDKLYDLMALDKRLRDELLIDLVQDRAVCFILSLYTFKPKLKDNFKITRGGTEDNFEQKLLSILQGENYWQMLHYKQQIVLKEAFTSAFNATIFYTYASIVYSKEEILDYLSAQKDPQEIPYILLSHNNRRRPFYFKTINNGRVKYNNLTSTFNIPVANNTTTLIDSAGQVLGVADVKFGDYLMGKASLSSTSYNFSTKGSIAEIQHKLNGTTKYNKALIFMEDSWTIIEKTKETLELDIVDLEFNERYDIIGLWVKYKDTPYLILTKKVGMLIDKPLNDYKVMIKAHITLDEKLKQVEFIKLIKERYE